MESCRFKLMLKEYRRGEFATVDQGVALAVTAGYPIPDT
jgi:hypothetical protein